MLALVTDVVYKQHNMGQMRGAHTKKSWKGKNQLAYFRLISAWQTGFVVTRVE
jgi:hypothetical protein